MQNEQTLLNIGFKHFPSWDFHQKGGGGISEFYRKNYRFDKGGKTFRAYVDDTNPPTYVRMGIVSDANINKVKCWMDCCSSGSVQRKIDRELKD